MKRGLKWLGLGVAGLAALVMVAALGAWGFVNTTTGRAWLTETVSGALSDPTMTVEINGLAGPLPQTLTLDRVTVADAEGTWLTLEDAALDWNPLALLGGRVSVSRIAAARVTLDRLPEGEDAPAEPGPSEPFTVPELPVSIRVDELRLARIALGAPVLGTPAEFRAVGRLGAPLAGELATKLEMTRLDAPGGDASLDVAFNPTSRALTVDAHVQGEAGGVLARSLGLPPRQTVRADLTGSGPIHAWEGQLRARLGADARADLLLTLADARELTVAGEVMPGPLVPAELRDLIGPRVRLDVTGAYDADARVARLAESRITTTTTAITLDGRYGLDSGTVDARLGLRVTDPAPLNAMLAPVGLEGLEAELRASGQSDAPKLHASISADRLRSQDATLTALDLTAAMAPQPGFRTGDVEATLTGEQVALADPALAGFSEVPVRLDAEARLDLADARVTGVRADAEVGGTTLSLRDGEAGFDGQRASADYTLRLDRLARLDPLLKLGLRGQGTLTGTARFAADAPEMLRADVAGDLSELAWREPALGALAGGDVDLATDVTLAPDGALTLANTRLDSRTTQVAGTVAIPGDFATLNADLEGQVRDLAPLGAALSVPMAGRADVEATLSGPLGDPSLSARLRGRETVLAGTPLGRLDIETELTRLASGLRGRLAAESSEGPAGAISVRTQLALGGGEFRLREGEAAVPGLTARGVALTVPLTGGVMTGRADLQADNIGTLAPLRGTGLRGRLDGTLTLGPGARGQGATLEAVLDNLGQANGPRAERVELSANLDNTFTDLDADVRIDGTRIRAGDITLDTLRVSASGGPSDMRVEVTGDGDFYGPLGLDAAARLRETDGARAVTLTEMSARVQARDLSLAEPATLTLDGPRLRLETLRLRAESGRLTARLDKTAEQVEGRLTLDALPADLANLVLAEPQLTGNLDGEVTLRGPVAAPRAEWRLEASKLTAKEADLPPLTARLDGGIADGALRVSGRIEGLSDTPVTVEAAGPFRFAVAPLDMGPVGDGALSASVDWQGDIAPLMPLIPVEGHRLGGVADVALSVDGTWNRPAPRGAIKLSDGAYESLEAGTLLTDVTATIEATPDRLKITEFSASDGEDGTLSVTGQVDLATAEGLRIALDIASDDAVLVRRDELTAAFDSDIAIEGPVSDMTVGGTITVVRGEARLPETLPPEVATLEVTEVGGETGAEPRQGRAPSGDGHPTQGEPDPPSRIALDLKVVVPNQLFVRGRGLNSEWQGELDVGGTANAPVIKGSLSAVRGSIDALSKLFELDSGTVTFDGGAEIDPRIDVKAVHEGPDLTVTVSVSGPAARPGLSLRSSPTLPQDEILSRLLFGEQVTDLTAGQAAQLGAAAAELAGLTGSGPGVLDRVRQSLGVDVLRLGGTGADTSVTAGEYLSDDVFVGVEQGAATDSGRVTLEYGLTDNIALESNVGATGDSDVGIQFKWDY